MRIEIDNETLFINGTSFCACACDLESGVYDVVARVADGDLSIIIVGTGLRFLDDCDDVGVLVAEYIVDGTPINARATLAKLCKRIVDAIDKGQSVELEVM